MGDDATSHQTVGPYFHIGLSRRERGDLAAGGARGEPVSLRGRVLDGDGAGVRDCLIEFWQADARGRYAHPEDPAAREADPAFRGFGRVWTAEDGSFAFRTVKPGPVPGPGGRIQAPHLVALVFMRGLLRHLVTRVYFPGDPRNEADPVLDLVPRDRRATLVARRGAADPAALAWDVVLQGDGETVFFDA